MMIDLIDECRILYVLHHSPAFWILTLAVTDMLKMYSLCDIIHLRRKADVVIIGNSRH